MMLSIISNFEREDVGQVSTATEGSIRGEGNISSVAAADPQARDDPRVRNGSTESRH
jgi:hypothetical protein